MTFCSLGVGPLMPGGGRAGFCGCCKGRNQAFVVVVGVAVVDVVVVDVDEAGVAVAEADDDEAFPFAVALERLK